VRLARRLRRGGKTAVEVLEHLILELPAMHHFSVSFVPPTPKRFISPGSSRCISAKP
jgi:hypothetical protein